MGARMSIEDKIFDIKSALEGKPEYKDFEYIEDIIPGSILLEDISEELQRLAIMLKQSNCGIENNVEFWPEQSDKYEYERIMQFVYILRGML